MTTDSLLEAHDRVWLRWGLSHEAITGAMWPCLCETWERLPPADRAALRFRFTVIDNPDRHASTGVRLGLLPDMDRIIIGLGRDIPLDELPAVFAHELAHVHLGHVTPDDARAHPVLRILPGRVSSEIAAALVADGWQEHAFSPAEDAREAAAWAQARAWGFTLPERG